MAQRVVGIDIGAQRIKVVHLTVSMRAFTAALYDEEEVPALRDGEGELLPFMARARAALEKLRERGALRGDLFITGLPGNAATTRLVRLPFADPKRIEATLPYEVEAHVPFDLDDMIMCRHVLKGQVEGMTDVLVGLARKADVAELLATLKSVGVDPRHVELDALALDDLYRHLFAAEDNADPPTLTPGGTVIDRSPYAGEPATAILDLGHQRTSLCIVAGDQVVAARTVMRGGADLTRELARSFSLPLDEAEAGKLREAFIEVKDQAAPYPEQQRISDCLKQALAPIVREVRQSVQAVVAQRRARVVRIYLCGGGARVPNLDRYLAEQLNVEVRLGKQVAEVLAPALPVDPGQGARDMGHAAKALAYALSGYAGQSSERLDFRQGDLAYRGHFEVFEGRAPNLAAGLMIIGLLLGFNGYASHFVVSRQESKVAQRQEQACQKILGREVKSGTRCLAMIHEQIGTGGGDVSGIPQRSVIDTYLELAKSTPKGVRVKVEELEIDLDRMLVKGQTASFEAVDKIVESLEKGQCFSSVTRGPARQSEDKVLYSLTVDVNCSKERAGAPAAGSEGGASDGQR